MGTLAFRVSLMMLIVFASNCHAQLCNRQDTRYTSCNHTTPVCECVPVNGNQCYFCFEIEQRHTFTRYLLDQRDIEIPGDSGRVVYFDNEGQLNEFPPEADQPPPRPPMCTMENCTQPYVVDGNSFRPILTINNRFPGPTLIVPNNAIVVVDVYNRLSSEATSIHWHGMHQMNTPWMDGVEHITQCGIAPSSSFRYIFRARPPGTHWYHSHSGAQRTDGLFGALIVKEDIKPNILEGVIDLPQSHTLTLLDWQKESSLDLFAQIHAGIRFFGQENPPKPEQDSRLPRTCSPDGTEVGPVTYWSGIINGLGRHRNIPYNQTTLSTFAVQAGEEYRFRLIGAQSLFAYRFSIDEHNLTLIATDGHFVQPREVDFIIIHSGERFDFILKTKKTVEKTDYIMRAETLEVEGSNTSSCRSSDIPLYPLYIDHNAEAILHYGSDDDVPNNIMYQQIADNSEPKYKQCPNSENCIAVNCPFRQFPAQYGIQCIHIHDLNLLSPVYGGFENPTSLFFNFGFEGDGSTSTINGRNFVFPSVPLQLDDTSQSDIPNMCQLNQLNSAGRDVCDDTGRIVTPDCLCTQVHSIESDKTYQFVFTAVGPNNRNWNFAHPVHLHGHSFRVAKIGFGNYSRDERIESASDDITCSNTFICTKPQWSNNNAPDDIRSINDNEIPLKDTVLVPAGGYAVVYFKANNPGYWFLHCHIEVHQLEGMAVVINEAENTQNSAPTNMPRCGPFTWSVEEFMESETPAPSPTPSSKATTIKESLFFVLFIGLLSTLL